MAVSIAFQNLRGGSGDFMADGSVPMSGDLDMGTNKIINMLDPVNDQDAATRKFVMDQVAEVLAKAAVLGTL